MATNRSPGDGAVSSATTTGHDSRVPSADDAGRVVAAACTAIVGGDGDALEDAAFALLGIARRWQAVDGDPPATHCDDGNARGES